MDLFNPSDLTFFVNQMMTFNHYDAGFRRWAATATIIKRPVTDEKWAYTFGDYSRKGAERVLNRILRYNGFDNGRLSIQYDNKGNLVLLYKWKKSLAVQAVDHVVYSAKDIGTEIVYAIGRIIAIAVSFAIIYIVYIAIIKPWMLG